MCALTLCPICVSVVQLTFDHHVRAVSSHGCGLLLHLPGVQMVAMGGKCISIDENVFGMIVPKRIVRITHKHIDSAIDGTPVLVPVRRPDRHHGDPRTAHQRVSRHIRQQPVAAEEQAEQLQGSRTEFEEREYITMKCNQMQVQ